MVKLNYIYLLKLGIHLDFKSLSKSKISTQQKNKRIKAYYLNIKNNNNLQLNIINLDKTIYFMQKVYYLMFYLLNNNIKANFLCTTQNKFLINFLKSKNSNHNNLTFWKDFFLFNNSSNWEKTNQVPYKKNFKNFLKYKYASLMFFLDMKDISKLIIKELLYFNVPYFLLLNNKVNPKLVPYIPYFIPSGSSSLDINYFYIKFFYKNIENLQKQKFLYK